MPIWTRQPKFYAGCKFIKTYAPPQFYSCFDAYLEVYHWERFFDNKSDDPDNTNLNAKFNISDGKCV